jgi:hypothetical protein
MTIDQVFTAAQELPPAAQSELIDRLLMQQPVDSEVEAAHLRVVHSRRDAYLAGEAKIVDGPGVLQSLRQRLS